MKITHSTLQMSSAHVAMQQHSVSERLNLWVGERPAQQTPAASNNASDVQLSDAGKAAVSDASQNDATENDPQLRLIRSLIEMLTGRQIKVFNASDIASTDTPVPPNETSTPAANPTPAAGWGLAYDRQESFSESEQTQFSASGKVTTADGREIAFSVNLSMSRSYHMESSTSLRLGDAARKTDPLVLNFSGNATQLTDQRFAFDLNSDGQAEQISFVAPGSGFLVFDRNSDGKVNNGKELFGPSSNDGFQELAALDDDRNGWIDENDAAYSQLKIWTRDTQGADQLHSLAAANIGTIALSRVATPFNLTNGANQTLGQIRNSGIFLQENGTAGTIQQIDLTA